MFSLVSGSVVSSRSGSGQEYNFRYFPGGIPFSLENTLMKWGRSLNPTRKPISDTDLPECFRSSQAVFRRYCVTNRENVVPLQRLK